MMTKTFRNTLLGAAMASLAGVAASAADTIRIPVNAWTGQNISAHITGTLMGELGYDVEYVTAGAVPQISAMAQGTLHLQPEFWDNNVGNIYDKALADGDIKIVGPLGLEPTEGWMYPPYMKEQCPGLPDYQALYDCAQAFATSSTFPNGRLITYPADWGTRSKTLVEKLELPFQPVAGGSEGAMIAELKSAVSAKQPMLMMFWLPHWIHADYDFEFVQFDGDGTDCPPVEEQSRGDACGFAQANVHKLVSGDFAATWPDAHALVEKIHLTNGEQNTMILEIDQEGKSLEEVVAAWIAENEGTWSGWVETARAAQD